MNKRLVIINQSTGFLMIDVANAYLKKYNEVVLITGRVSKLERELDSNIEIDKIIPYNKRMLILVCSPGFGVQFKSF